MARSSKPHMGSQHRIYVSLPELTQQERAHSHEGADAVCTALLSHGIGSGDVVFVSTFTHPRVAEAITRSGAEPIFVDVTLETWHVSAEVLDIAAQWCLSVGSTPKALVMVDAYGLRFDSDALREVCWKYDMAVIEDHLASEGSARLTRPPVVVARRREIHARYRRGLEGTPGVRFMPAVNSAAWNPWLTCVVFEEFDMRDRVMAALGDVAIECSYLWRPLHTVPAYADATAIVDGTAEYLFEHGLRLPSSSTLTDSRVDEVIETVVAVLG
ncbi:MAG: DegT/DnrJ/EryC1/StrS family aminotransferase [Actinomycetota bacterium]